MPPNLYGKILTCHTTLDWYSLIAIYLVHVCQTIHVLHVIKIFQALPLLSLCMKRVLHAQGESLVLRLSHARRLSLY